MKSIVCKQCGVSFDALSRHFKLCPNCKKTNEDKRNEHHCIRCKKVYNQKEEYKNHQGTKSRTLCKTCSDDWKLHHCEDFIQRVLSCKKRYDSFTHVVYTLEDEIRYMLEDSRNDVRSFGWNMGLVSKEYIIAAAKNKKIKYTMDHINGMVSIITETAMRIIDGRLKTPEDVVFFLDQKSCVIKVTQKLNTTTLKKLQNKGKIHISPQAYYDACEGIFFEGNELTYKEFFDNFSEYFIFSA